jgi:hypothetical protein
MDLEKLGLAIDRLENLCFSINIPLRPEVHVQQLRQSLPEIVEELKAGFIEVTGEKSMGIMERKLFHEGCGIAIIGMPGHLGSVVEALIAAHRLTEDNIQILDIENMPPASFKEIEDFSFARSNRNLDFDRLAMHEYIGYDVKRVRKPVNTEWKRRMKNLQNMV